MWKVFFFFSSRGTDWSQRLDVDALDRLLDVCFCCHSVLDGSKMCKITLPPQKTCTIILYLLLIYSDALHSLDHNTLYLLQTLNGHGYRCLGNEKKCNHYSDFSHFYFTILCLINLKIAFYCTWLYLFKYIYIYIFTQKYMYIYIMSMYKRFSFQYLLLWTLYLHFVTSLFFILGQRLMY